METLFATIWNSYNSSLVNGTNTVISSGLTAASSVLTVCLTAFVIVQAVLILYGALTFGDGMRAILRAMFVCAALTPTYFNTYVRDVFTDWLPTWIAGAISNGATGATGAQQFDQLRSAFHHSAATVSQLTGITHVAEGISIIIASVSFDAAILVTFLVWASARILMALVVCVGPFIIVLWLFEFTRGVIERWVGKMISLGLLMLLVSVLLKVVMVQEQAYIRTAQATTGDLSVQIGALWNIVIVVVIGALLLVTLPAIAAHIGGGVSFSVSPMLSRMGSGSASSMASSAKGIAKAVKSLKSKLSNKKE